MNRIGILISMLVTSFRKEFKTYPFTTMKTKLLAVAFITLAPNCFAQDGLTFSKAFYLGITSDHVSDYIAKDTTITVANGKVWLITSAAAFKSLNYKVTDIHTFLYLNEQVISYTTAATGRSTNSIWLPAGKYKISIRTEERNQPGGKFSYNGFISGIEYDVLRK